MNDLPMADTPLNVQHLHIFNNGQPLTEGKNCVTASHFELSINAFTNLLTVLLKYTQYYPYPTFILTFQDADLLKISFVKTIRPKHLASKIFSNPGSSNNNLRDNFVTSINGTRVFTSYDALK